MWMEYNEMNKKYDIQASLITLSVLSSVTDKQYVMKSMEEIKKYLQNNQLDKNSVDITSLIGMYRKAVSVQDKELIDMLKPIVIANWQNPEEHEYVVADIEYGNEKVQFENCYRNEKSQNLYLLDFIDKLSEIIGHDSRLLISEKKPYSLSEYHAEKIALGFVLNKDKDRTEIKINVNMRMCNDCHLFFAE